MGLGHPVGHQGIGSGVNCRGNGSAEWDRMWRGTERSHGGAVYRKQGAPGRYRPMEREQCGMASDIAAGQRLDVLGGVSAARSNHPIGHELGASGGEYCAIKEGKSSGGNGP